MKEDTNFLVFANKYNLDLEDLLTLNYVIQEDTPLQEGDEIFLPITIEKAYALGIEDRPKPKPKPTYIAQQPSGTPSSATTHTNTSSTQAAQPAARPSGSSVTQAAQPAARPSGSG